MSQDQGQRREQLRRVLRRMNGYKLMAEHGLRFILYNETCIDLI